jgi:hypothetical protein
VAIRHGCPPLPARINRGYNSGTIKDTIGKLEPDLSIVATNTE